MKLSKIGFLLGIIMILSSCASGYHMINPNSLNYNSNDIKNGISLEYKYDLMNKKYAKKETKKGIKVVAIKIINNSENDIVFGSDLKLEYENGNELNILENNKVFKTLKQNTVTHLLYLLLTPLTFSTSTTNGNQTDTNSLPIGLFLGPILAGANMINAGTANKKFKSELLEFNINGITIKKGETKSGLIGIKSDNYDAIKIKMK